MTTKTLTKAQLQTLRVFAEGAVAGYADPPEGMDLWVDFTPYNVCVNVTDVAIGDDAANLVASVYPLTKVKRGRREYTSQDTTRCLCENLFEEGV